MDDGDYSETNLQRLAREHLWMHFSRHASFKDHPIPIIVRGEGCYVYDETGKRYLDGLAALFCVNVGHGRAEIAKAAHEQLTELDFFTNWSYAHPPAIHLASKLASLTPGDLDHVFFVNSGSEAVESALKVARQYHHLRGEPKRTKFIARELAYHGTTMGALTATGLPGLRDPFKPLVPGGLHVPNTNTYHWPEGRDSLWSADKLEEKILEEGPDTIAAVIMEPLQNAGGCFTPPDGYFTKVRELCDKHGILLISDEVICGFGRLGYWFGAQRYQYQPDIITVAKALTSAYAPMGAMIASEKIAATFMHDKELFIHGSTFGGHPLSAAIALANIQILEDENLCQHVLDNEPLFKVSLDSLKSIPIVGDIRGAGYFWAIELVKDKETKAGFNHEEAERLLRGFISKECYAQGLICRADDRGDPVIQLSPPLIAGAEQFEEIRSILADVLSRASDML